jgi:hypothetical protein
MKNTGRRLFHPDDIKTFGLGSTAPGPMSAPLPGLRKQGSRSSSSPSGTIGATPLPAAPASAGPANSGSFGRLEAQRLRNQTGFDKYAEEDDEDYEDVFGKLNSTGS